MNIYYHAWNCLPGISISRFKKIMGRFNDPEKAWHAMRIDDLRELHFSEEKITEITIFRKQFDFEREKQLLQKAQIHLLPCTDPAFSQLLCEIHDPPILLYYKGNKPDFLKPSVAIVGTRFPSEYGYKTAVYFAERLTEYGITIVSGFACGIDQIAHETALAAGGRTIGVLGSGLSQIYPANKKRIEQMIAHGTFLSEFPPSAPPEPHHFPQRNRIISGISLGTLVIEAGDRSGALITAQSALEQNRAVFAVPGNINQPLSAGTNFAIKNNIAQLVRSADDILEELKLSPQTKIPENLAHEEQLVLEYLQTGPKHIDEITRHTKNSAAATGSLLATMVLKGLVTEQLNKFQIH